MSRDLGDFPTPPPLVAAVLERLGPIGERWTRVLEPTCGAGHFLKGVLQGASPPRELRGIEIQPGHFEAASAVVRNAARATNAEVLRANLFDLDLRRDLNWREAGPLLVVGNPPWVTNAELGALGSENLPRKSNVKKLRGIDARTGASNFDIAEAVWLKLIAELTGESVTIALLCKTSVARSVLQFAERMELPFAEASIVRLNARRWFRAAVDACLFQVVLDPTRGHAGAARVPVFADLSLAEADSTIGFVQGRVVANLDAYLPLAFADGCCPLTWRQGLKHDAASVIELERDPFTGRLRNKLGEPVDVEPSSIYPLLKGADLLRGPSSTQAGEETLPANRRVIVTQRRVGEDTRPLERTAPRLWAYLERHQAVFARRKSSIYRGRAPFAMFGLGPYSFAPYKVAVSGLGKSPRFHAIAPVGGRPVMFDDTCYFLPCRSPTQAAMTTALLNDPVTLEFIKTLMFAESKRPITKSLLARLDLAALSRYVDSQALIARAEDELTRLRLPADLTASGENGTLDPRVTAVSPDFPPA